MARKAREKSEIGIYLVNLKTVEEVNFSTDDRTNFLDILKENNVLVLAYALFNSSFVLTIKEDDRTIDSIVRQNCIKFVKHFNKKYNRNGKVFAGRYASFPAHEDKDVWEFISNIHTMTKIDDENINSLNSYFDNQYVYSAYAEKKLKTHDKFFKVCKGKTLGENGIKLSDEEIKNYIVNTFQIQPCNIEKLPKSLIGNVIDQVFKVTKASARQIARITSLPLRFLWNKAKKAKGEVENKDTK